MSTLSDFTEAVDADLGADECCGSGSNSRSGCDCECPCAAFACASDSDGEDAKGVDADSIADGRGCSLVLAPRTPSLRS